MAGREIPVVKRIERINAFPIGEVIKITERIDYSFEVTKRSDNEWEITSVNIVEKLGDKLSVKILALKFPAVFTRIIEEEQPELPRPKLQPKLQPLDDDLGGEL